MKQYKITYMVNGIEGSMIVSGDDNLTITEASDTCYYEHSDEGDYEEINISEVIA